MKASIPKGTRDFSPSEMMERNYIFDTIRNVYQSFAFQQIETPAMENLSTLLGKYGEEGDKLLYRLLNSGDPYSKLDASQVLESGNINSSYLAKSLSDKGLRYDLTVPFARFVVQHQNEIAFPFKRYQIQPVWRADRPQKGRYREFYQCDADIIGSKSLLNELELCQIIDKVFTKLDLKVSVHINNRKLLAGFAEICAAPDKVLDITIAIDKLEKIGLEAVIEEMRAKELSEDALLVIKDILAISGTNEERLAAIEALMSGKSISGIRSEEGLKGVEEIRQLFNLINSANLKSSFMIDLSLARGLNYYTGAIFEVKSEEVAIGSICGGGRYDNLTGIFGLANMSGVGISFGADRIYDVLKSLDRFPKYLYKTTDILFANMDENSLGYILSLVSDLREAGLSCEIYPDTVKLKKQFDYADKKSIPFISIIGENEINASLVNVKNLSTGEQKAFAREDIAAIIEYLKA